MTRADRLAYLALAVITVALIVDVVQAAIRGLA